VINITKPSPKHLHMSKKLLFTVTTSLILSSAALAQNYLDKYLTDPLTYTTIGNSGNSVNQPRDLDFKPNSNELWVINKGSSQGGSVVIFYNAGLSGQTSQYRKDSHSGHFMIYSSAMAFSEIGEWAAVSEIQNTNSQSATFMGPGLWSSDTSIFARVFQNNWMNGYPLGSHLDMLHQSPFSMGIAHDSAKVYWVFDGYNGNICKYDYVADHGPGYDNHSAGKIWRYTDVPVVRQPNVPSHMVLDKATRWLYYVDGGTMMLKRMDTNTGTISGNLTPPASGSEPLAGYWSVTGAVKETIDTFTTQICGIDIWQDRLIVGDYTNGNIYMYDISGAVPLFMDTIITNQPGIMGLEVGNDGRIWFVNNTANTVVRIDPLPAVNNYEKDFYSTGFNQCTNSIAPSVLLSNNGSALLTSATINYLIDNGPINTLNWTGTLATGSSITVALPAITVTPGGHKLTAYVSSPNGVADENTANDAKDGSFRVIDVVSTLPFTEGFSTTTFPPTGWSYVNYNPNNYMKRVTNAGGFGNSAGALKMDHYSGQMDITGQIDYLLTPRINLSSATSGYTLEFSVAYAQYNTSTSEDLRVKVSTDCGATWSTIYSKSGNTLSTANPQTSAFTPNASQWRRESISLAAYAGQPDVIFMFETESNFGNNMYLDDIQIANTTSIDEQADALSFTVYPNPASAQLTISTQESLSEVVIVNLLGEVVMKTRPAGSSYSYSIDVSTLSKGTYFIHARAGEKSSVQKLVIH
jgi:hypothetical protein